MDVDRGRRFRVLPFAERGALELPIRLGSMEYAANAVDSAHPQRRLRRDVTERWGADARKWRGTSGVRDTGAGQRGTARHRDAQDHVAQISNNAHGRTTTG